MDRDQERWHLAQADRHIALTKQHIASQHAVIAKLKLANDPTELAESLLSALEESLLVFQRHRKLILEYLQKVRTPSEGSTGSATVGHSTTR